MSQTIDGQLRETAPPGLNGKSILIVEDEIIIGMMLSSEIARAGGTPLGPVTSVTGALDHIRSRMAHAVILDAKLTDGSGAELVACLDERRIPYVVISGYDKASLPSALKAAPFVAKPIVMPLLMQAIQELDHGAAGR